MFFFFLSFVGFLAFLAVSRVFPCSSARFPPLLPFFFFLASSVCLFRAVGALSQLRPPPQSRIFIFPGVTLPPGEYRFTRWENTAASATKRRLQVFASWKLGSYWSGTANEFETRLSYKIPPWLTISFNTSQTFARLPQGNFAARILSGQVSYTASPFLSFSNLIQYDNRSRNLGWQSRTRWILRPGNDLFFVVNRGWRQDPDADFRFTAQESRVSAKLQYTFRY